MRDCVKWLHLLNVIGDERGVTSGTLGASREHPLPRHDPSSSTPRHLTLTTQAPSWCSSSGSSSVPPTRLGPLCLLFPWTSASPACRLWHLSCVVLQVRLVPAIPRARCVPRCLSKAASISPYSGPHSLSLLWNVEVFHHCK